MIGLPNVALVLLTLGKQMHRKSVPFTLAQMLEWEPTFGSTRTVRAVCLLLLDKGYLAARPSDEPYGKRNTANPAEWELTEVGLEAARAARKQSIAQAHKERNVAMNKARSYADALPARLWTLLRTRRALTCLEAEEVLGNAGEDTEQLRRRIGECFTRWHKLKPETIQVAVRRIGRFKRYVLIGDAGRFPPEELRNASDRLLQRRKTTEDRA